MTTARWATSRKPERPTQKDDGTNPEIGDGAGARAAALITVALMDRADVAVATQLLAKAQSTDAEEEAFALVLRTYRLLAQVITEHDLAAGHTTFGPRRRERRLLRDRRAANRQPNPPGLAGGAGEVGGASAAGELGGTGGSVPAPDATAARYRQQGGHPGEPAFLDLDL